MQSIRDEISRVEIQREMKLKHEDYFRKTYLMPALNSCLIEMTIPDKPKSSKHKY
ncbi:MAG: Fic family protein [Bacteroidota bacterium]